MKAEIISTGTELLLGKTLNTSVFYLTGQLSGMGIEVLFHTTVGDNKDRFLGVLRQALDRSGLIFLTGGLGPTADDLTKEITSFVLDLNMNFNQQSMDSIQRFFFTKHELPPGSEKQAFFPEGSKILPNDFGTAPGAMIQKDGKYCVFLPGPPAEMKPMFDHYVLPEILKITKDHARMHVRILKVFGLGESELERKLPDLMKQSSPFLTLIDKHTYMDLRISVRDRDETAALTALGQTEKVIRQRLGNHIFGIDEETHSQVVGGLLRQEKLTLATAESCSGGLLGGRITAEAGSSDYYLGGIVSYANSAKEGMLGVKTGSLMTFGAVSEEVAKEMADGARKVLSADLGLSITGIAGPGGGTEDKPVGLVYLALADAHGVRAERKLFSGNRESIRNMVVETALHMLRLYLLDRQ
ncbi:MAG: putative competence-damage inducible protein [Candidatus Dichloromethanomonas elyunquensis]|nr:MAG: putative competence-damage inducible protein [Candidatus Dichloromethanomonas elyunquensis]